MDIWRAIDTLAARHGLSASALARRAGLDATAFNRSKRFGKDGRPRWPSTESVAAALDAVHASLADLANIVAQNAACTGNTTPVMALELAHTGCFDADGRPTGPDWTLRRLEGIGGEPVWALEVMSDMLMPAVRPGDWLVISPDAPLRPGDRLVFGLQSGRVGVGELGDAGAGRVQVRPLGEEWPDNWACDEDIAWMTRILWIGR